LLESTGRAWQVLLQTYIEHLRGELEDEDGSTINHHGREVAFGPGSENKVCSPHAYVMYHLYVLDYTC
jgi:hypothetical protein